LRSWEMEELQILKSSKQDKEIDFSIY
jgi:hypothetical protein